MTTRPHTLAAAALLLALTATGAATALADHHQTPMTADDLLRTRLVPQARISPDGALTAYVLSVPRDPFAEDDGGAWSELHVIGPDDRHRPFITGDVSVRRIDFTPDGRGIAFLARRGDDEQTSLYVIPVDGGEARRVLTHESGVGEYAFSPDGKQVAFLARDARDKQRDKLAKKGFKAEAYEENPRYVRVHVADLDDDGTAGEPRTLDLDGSASLLSWSPDGAHLAVALAPTPSVDDGLMKRLVHTVRADDGAVVGRVETGGKLGAVVWSPDGERLALLAGADRHDPANGRLMVADATGGRPRDLRPGWEGDAEAVAWLDDDTLLYVAHQGLTTMLVRQDLDGATTVEVPAGGPALRSLDVAADGKRAVLTADTAASPREAYAWRRGQDRVTRLTDSNPWLAERRLARQEAVTYQARDGLTIEGLLIHPLDGAPEGGAPLVVMAHGGPEAHYSHGWITRYVSPGQILAGRGFAVFYPNYRGSTGRGVVFSKAGQGDYAGAEFDDLIDGIAHLARAGLVDRDRVGITGGSYGGYASAWAATALSEHFKASVMFVGVSELVSKFGTTDIPNEMNLVHARHWPWENWPLYDERSPVRHATKHRTPLLILHGKEDPRVHPSQSLTMYRFLKTLDQAPVRLVWYPGEGHGNRKAAARLDYALRLVRWMEHYVTGPGGDMPAFDLDEVTARLEGGDKAP